MFQGISTCEVACGGEKEDKATSTNEFPELVYPDSLFCSLKEDEEQKLCLIKEVEFFYRNYVDTDSKVQELLKDNRDKKELLRVSK